MDILDIAIAKQLAGGGGGSGTDNYNDLSNLPKINDVTLSGNKSSSALGLQSEITSENKLDSDLIDDTNQDNKFVTSIEKNTWNAKQNAIDADHKINADYVDDSTSTNKFVTATDKETWNAKQNAIDNSHKLSSDLVDDTNHTNKFVTSTEKNTWNGKQNAIDSEHKLSSSLVSFTTAEAAALASGIDSTKVAQISTNQSNILSVANRIGKNCYNIKNKNSVFADTNTLTIQSGTKSVTATVNADGSVTLTGATEGTTPTFILETGDLSKYAGMYLNGAYSDKVFFQMEQKTAPYDIYAKDIGSGAQIASSIPTEANFFIRLSSNFTIPGSITLKPMICDVDLKNIDPSYQPFALPNYDLTYLQAEDRAELVELVDSGAKNLYNPDVLSGVPTGLTVTRESDGTTLKINGTYTGTSNAYITIGHFANSKTGIYYMSSTCTKATYPTTYYIYTDDNHLVNSLDSVGSYNYTSAPNAAIVIRVSPNASFNNDTVKILISTKAAFGVSNKFVPYRPNYDLVSDYVATPRTKLVYIGINQNATTQRYTMKMSDFLYSQFNASTSECGTYLISVVTWGVTPKQGLWIVSYSGSVTSYAVLTNIVGPDSANVSVVTDVNDPYIEVTASGKVTISTLN